MFERQVWLDERSDCLKIFQICTAKNNFATQGYGVVWGRRKCIRGGVAKKKDLTGQGGGRPCEPDRHQPFMPLAHAIAWSTKCAFYAPRMLGGEKVPCAAEGIDFCKNIFFEIIPFRLLQNKAHWGCEDGMELRWDGIGMWDDGAWGWDGAVGDGIGHVRCTEVIIAHNLNNCISWWVES